MGGGGCTEMLLSNLMNEVQLSRRRVSEEFSQVTGLVLVFKNPGSEVVHLLCGKIPLVFFVGEVNSNESP